MKLLDRKWRAEKFGNDYGKEFAGWYYFLGGSDIVELIEYSREIPKFCFVNMGEPDQSDGREWIGPFSNFAEAKKSALALLSKMKRECLGVIDRKINSVAVMQEPKRKSIYRFRCF
jgi:hypothetical protein